MPAGPLDRSGDGAVAQGPHANKGGQGDTLRPFGGEHHRSLSSVSSWEQLWMGSCLMQHGMEEMHPRMRMRLGHPKELSWHCLNGVLGHIRQHDELFVGYRRSRTMVIGPVTTARAGWPIDGAVLQRGRQRVLERGQQRGECWLGSPRHRPSTPGTLGHILVAWHRHLRHAMIGREA
jgi:hypothetical protein